MSRLATLERAQAASVEELADPRLEDLVRQLATTACLLELAKLAAGQRDLNTWAEAVVRTIPQFLAVRACRIEASFDGVAPVSVAYGSDAGADTTRVDLGGAVLELVAAGNAAAVVAELAPMLSEHVTAICAAERDRRLAAAAEALSLAARVDLDAASADFSALASALASLPRAVGAVLAVCHPSGADSFAAGCVSNEHLVHLAAELEDGRVEVDVAFASPPTADDLDTLERITAVLSRTLQQAEAAIRLRAEAETDPMTRADNRRGASRVLRSMIDSARAGRPLTACAFDLDHFKRVNDELGHGAGDEVLRLFAAGVQATLEQGERLCRMGGEEFLVLTHRSLTAALALAEVIVEATPGWCAPALAPAWHQTVSAGVSAFDPDDQPADLFLRTADEALYHAKRAGRNRVAPAV